MPIYSCEIERIIENKTVVRTLNSNFNLAPRILKADGVALMEPRNPDFISQLENMVGVGAVRFRGRNLAVINVPGKNAPGILAHHVPVAQKLSSKRTLGNNIESGHHHQQRILRSRVDVVNIVEKRKRNISR